MKKENGITLASLVVYVILMLLVVVGVGTITSSFYTNISEYDSISGDVVAYSKFNMYFINDIKRNEAKIEEYYTDYIILSYVDEDSGSTEYVEYTVQNNIMYRNQVKICDDVESISITADVNAGTIRISMQIGDYSKVSNYVVENLGNVDTTIEI